jgi:hypothetical protein
MKQLFFLSAMVCAAFTSNAQNGNVGIGTSTPLARLHVADSSVVFTAAGAIPGLQGNPPVSGAGRRMMWYADKAAFRTGFVSGTQWDKNNTGNFSFSFGTDNTASGGYSFAGGFNNTASNDNATAWGSSNIASGQYSWAAGFNNAASGDFAATYGTLNTARSRSSFITGVNNKSQSYGAFVTGYFNDTTATGSAVTINPQNRIFQIGNGTANNSRCNAVTVLQNGAVGIGTAIPDSKALVDMSSSNKGFLPPRLSEDSLNAMGAVTEGMVAFNTTRKCMMLYSNGSWNCMTGNTSADKFQVTATSFFSGADSSTLSEILDMETVNGNYYVTGYFVGGKLNLGNGIELVSGPAVATTTHGFIARYDSAGNCIWAVKLVGSVLGSVIAPRAITVNNAGSVFVTGSFNDSMYLFNANGSLFNRLAPSVAGDYDIFILKLKPNGTVDWRRKEGSGGGVEEGLGITLNFTDVFICGQFHGSQTLGSGLTRAISSIGGQDGFYASYDTLTGTNCYDAFRIGGTGDDQINDISINGLYAYFTGSYENSLNLQVIGLIPAVVNSLGGADMFVAKHQIGFPLFNWVLYARGNVSETGQKLVLKNQQLYVAGNFSSNNTSFRLDHATANGIPPALNSKGSSDIMVFRINESDGDYNPVSSTAPSWISTIGGTGADAVKSLDAGINFCFVGGEFTNNATFENGYPMYGSGGLDGFAAVLTTATGDLYKATTIGSPYSDKCNVLLQRTNGDLAIAGSCAQTVNYNGISSGKPLSSTRQAYMWVLK